MGFATVRETAEMSCGGFPVACRSMGLRARRCGPGGDTVSEPVGSTSPHFAPAAVGDFHGWIARTEPLAPLAAGGAHGHRRIRPFTNYFARYSRN
jgi:hypothetical protein